jgi:hypothetical protein
MSSSGWTGYIQKVDWTSRADSMASLVPGSSSQDNWRSIRKTSSSYDNGRCQLVKTCSTECHSAHCRLPWNGRRPFRKRTGTMRRPWFDHLTACAIWRWLLSWKLNVTECFRLIFNKESHYGEPLREFRFACVYVGLCTCITGIRYCTWYDITIWIIAFKVSEQHFGFLTYSGYKPTYSPWAIRRRRLLSDRFK